MCSLRLIGSGCLRTGRWATNFPAQCVVVRTEGKHFICLDIHPWTFLVKLEVYCFPFQMNQKSLFYNLIWNVTAAFSTVAHVLQHSDKMGRAEWIPSALWDIFSPLFFPPHWLMSPGAWPRNIFLTFLWNWDTTWKHDLGQRREHEGTLSSDSGASPEREVWVIFLAWRVQKHFMIQTPRSKHELSP